MEGFKFIQSVLKYNKLMGELYYSHLQRVANKHSLSVPEAELLLLFTNNSDAKSATDAIAIRGFSKAYVSSALDGLAKKGYICTRETSEDRRTKTVEILPLAVEVQEDLKIMQLNFLNQILKGFKQKDVKLIFESLNKLSNNIKEMANEGE